MGITPAEFALLQARVSGKNASTSGNKDVSAKVEIKKSTDESKLNKLESDWLHHLRTVKQHPWIGVQCLTLKLGDDTRYTPDFISIDTDGKLVAWETKGEFQREDSWIKLKIAARQFSWINFIKVTMESGNWKEQEIKP